MRAPSLASLSATSGTTLTRVSRGALSRSAPMVTDIHAPRMASRMAGHPRVWKSPIELRSCDVEFLHTSAVSYAAMLGIDLERADHGLPDDFAIVATPAAHGRRRHAARVDRLQGSRATVHPRAGGLHVRLAAV